VFHASSAIRAFCAAVSIVSNPSLRTLAWGSFCDAHRGVLIKDYCRSLLSKNSRALCAQALATHVREGSGRASNSRRWCPFCACVYCRVVARTYTCFCGVLAQRIPMAMGCGHRQTQSEPDTLAHRGYNQPTSPERLPSLRLPCQLPASAMLSST
jgi:hypothetical protein